MARYDQDTTDIDPEEQLRQRILDQQSGGTAPAPAPSEPTTAQPTTEPAPFSGGGGAPLPQDPYYQAYQNQNPTPGAAPAVGPQINFDNTPLPSAPAPTGGGRTDRNYILQQVNQWMQASNPQGHQDPEYWVRRIMETGGLGADNTGYWMGRFTEAPGTHQEGTPIATQPQGPSVAQNFVAGLQAPQGAWNQEFMQQLRQMLMQRLHSAGQPVDPNDPNISQPLTAARDEASRATDKERTAMAERLYAQGGLNTDALNQGIQQSGERNAVGLGSLRAQLITREVEARRSELKDLMQMALASGDAESARMIQMQLAALEAQLREEGWGIDLAKFEAGLNQNAALAGLGG